MISIIICYFSVISAVIAFDVSIYSSTIYYNSITKIPIRILQDKYNFLYHPNDVLMMDVRLKIAPSVIATAHITQKLISSENPGDTSTKNMTYCSGVPCFSFKYTKLNSSSIHIGIQLKRGSTTCGTHIFTEGNKTSYATKDDMCLKPKICVIEIDLQNVQCNETIVGTTEVSWPSSPSPQSVSPNSMSIYVVTSVVGTICVLILAICCVKKRCHRNSNLEETMEMNSYDPSKEIIYADLGFAQEHSKPPDGHPPRKVEEESPYAQIIGVLHPKKLSH